MQRAVSSGELQVLKHFRIVHNLQRIEYIAALRLRGNQRILKQHLQIGLQRGIVIAIRRRERVVLGIVNHRRLDVEEGNEVGHVTLVFHNVTPNHSLSRQEEMTRLLLGELGVHCELLHVLLHQLQHLRNVLFFQRTESGNRELLCWR